MSQRWFPTSLLTRWDQPSFRSNVYTSPPIYEGVGPLWAGYKKTNRSRLITFAQIKSVLSLQYLNPNGIQNLLNSTTADLSAIPRLQKMFSSLREVGLPTLLGHQKADSNVLRTIPIYKNYKVFAQKANFLSTQVFNSIMSRNLSTKVKQCKPLSFKCNVNLEEKPKEKPVEEKKPCRKRKPCVSKPSDCCLSSLPPILPNIPPKPVICCIPKKEPPNCRAKFKLPLDYCKEAEKRCMEIKRKQCVKIEVPIPSFSECILEFDPLGRSKLDECCMADGRQRQLQPSTNLLSNYKRNLYTPEIELIVDPCLGECCKLEITDHPCPTKKAGMSKMKCQFLGISPIAGCLPKENTICGLFDRKKCTKRLAPNPAFSECIKNVAAGPPYTENRVAALIDKMYFNMRIKKIRITEPNIKQYIKSCNKTGITWNCDSKDKRVCKQAKEQLDCGNCKQERANNSDCSVDPDACHMKPYKTGQSLGVVN